MTAYGLSDVGRVRETNQDAFLCGELSEKAVFAVVCDGMGGGKDGNIASAIAVKVISNRIVENYYDGIKDSNLKNIMENAIDAANIEVFDYDKNDKKTSKDNASMGTTVVLALLVEDKLHLAHVGDSRAYLIDKDGMKQITKDHTLVQNMVEEGKITKEEAKNHPRKNLITRAVGIDDRVDSDYSVFDIGEEAGLLICTDGLTNMVSDDDIHRFVLEEKENSQIPAKLIHEANMAGGSDNITVIYMV